jgi:cobalt-zinc-cadmium resistance protein CzcA
LKLYTDFSDKASLRLKAGESNILEKTTASNQKSAIEIQLIQLQQELAVLHHQFRWLLNSEGDFVPNDSKYFAASLKNDLNEHPLLKILQQQKNISAEQISLEKAKMLPGLQLAYNLNSFKGMGADDKVYNATPQFHSVQVGVFLLFFQVDKKPE